MLPQRKRFILHRRPFIRAVCVRLITNFTVSLFARFYGDADIILIYLIAAGVIIWRRQALLLPYICFRRLRGSLFRCCRALTPLYIALA